MLVLCPFCLAWLPGAGKLLADGAWVMLGLLLLRCRRDTGPGPGKTLQMTVALLLGLGVGTALVRMVPLRYILWGGRNRFRFYVCFFGCARFLEEQDREAIWRVLDRLFWGNLAVMLGQFFLLGCRGDYLGGLFGREQGCNGSVNLFFLMMTARHMVCYLEGLENAKKCFGVCLGALLLAALAELKFFFLEFLGVLVLAMVLCPVSRRKWRLLGLGILGAVGCGALLYRLFPEFGGWFRPERMLETALGSQGYASTGDLNRLGCIHQIRFRLAPGFWQRLLGLGLGSCGYAGAEVLTTPFYREYGWLHYTWISVAFRYLEGGALGLGGFLGFFLLVLAQARRESRCRTGACRGQCRVSAILAVMCLLVGIYNASLETEAAYFVYFGLAGCFGGGQWKKD